MTLCKEEAAYYLRFISMYIDLGSEVTLKVFIHHTPGKDAESFLLSNTLKLQQLKNNKTINKQESDLVLTSTPNPKEFDISLLIILSINLFSEQELPPPKKGWSIPPKNSDTSIAADLLRLRTIRNLIIGHRAKAQLPQWRFEDEWENVLKIFLRIYRTVAPDEESQLKKRIDDYRLRTLDPFIEDKYDSKLHEWQQQISEIQQQVEDAFKTVEDIDKYLKSKSDRYERYIKLLVKGGRFVILALVEKNIKAQNRNLRDILKDNEDNVRNNIVNPDHLHVLYPSDQGHSSDPIDMSTWDITLLVSLLLFVLDSSSLDDDDKEEIINIDTARKNYAEAAVISLDSDAFAAYSGSLQSSIRYLSRYLDPQKKKECKEILSECTNISKGSDANQTFFEELKSQSMMIKSIQEIYEEKIKKTKHILQDMITHGIFFKNQHVMELKMVTLGCDEEKKQLGENVLTDVWREALERSGDSTDFDVVKKEVLKILTEIKKPNGVTRVNVKQGCILLGITCKSPCTFLGLLNYFESIEFNLSMQSISSELGYIFNTIFTIQGNVTLESLVEIITDGEHDNIKDEGISIPITITSPEAVMQLRTLFKSKAMMNSTNTIADSLSEYLKETVKLKMSLHMGNIHSLFDGLETEHSSLESSSDDAEHMEVPENNSNSKADAKQNLSTSDLTALEYSEEKYRIEQELVMRQKEDTTKNTAHKLQLDNKKYRNWVKAGLGIKYVKEGLEPFCDSLVKKQHIDILERVKQKQNLTTVSCGLCDERTLQPDHVQTITRQCPLGQTYCNCLQSRGKSACPNRTCGAIYDEIVQLHASTPPVPNWKNTDAKQWCTEQWAVAKCFINSPGYENKNSAAEFDCTGLLHVLLNNIDFRKHIKCVIDGTDVFSRVHKSRNDIFHSDNMELEYTEATSYIDDMIELLEDDKEIKHKQVSKDAVKKLQELKREHFVISTNDEAEVRRVAMAAINNKETELEQTITDADFKRKKTADEHIQNMDEKGSVLKSELEHIGQNLSAKEVEETGKLEQNLEESKLQLKSHKNLTEKKSMTISAETRKDDVAIKERKDFQEKLIKLYEGDVKKLFPFPWLHKNKRNVDDMYVPPWMTEYKKNEETGRWNKVTITMDKLFRKNENPAKCIHVIGEAGSGKSTFCKMLVHFWCLAHSEQEGSSNEPDIVNEMKRFDFLFYVSLRYYSDYDCIEKMLEKSFYDPALGDILHNDSSKCLIVLDGLDDWNLKRKYNSQFQTSGIPGREHDADYTIITTSRKWKFDALSSSDNEVGKKIKLKGFGEYEMRNLTVKTVEILNDIHQKNKDAEECMIDLESRQVSDISHTPLMMQQLVCLWFNDKLRGNSKCAIYGSMLDLFLEWKALDTSEIQEVKQYLSYLAYETLFDKIKESTLTFSSSKLIQLSIPHDVIQDCLASGILNEERNVSLSQNMQSTISFFHKSVQEYLAAVYIASQFKEMLSLKDENYHKSLHKLSSARIVFGSRKDEHALTDVGNKCVDKYFSSCKTVADILDQSNVFILLCGLEPRLLTDVSEYIYNVSLLDKIVVTKRNEIPERYSLYHSVLINDIQTCIFNCIGEVLPSTQLESVHSPVYIADLYVSRSTDLLRYYHNIILKNVLSVEIVDAPYRVTTRDEKDNEAFYLAVNHLTKCDQLKVIKYEDLSDKSVYHEVTTTIIAKNINTLETVSLLNINEIMVSRLVLKLPKMRQLTSLQVKMGSCDSVPHNVMLSLSEFLNRTTRLQHISLDIDCDKYDTHKIDLSKHKKLQHINFRHFGSFCLVSCNTDNLKTLELIITRVDVMNQVCNILCKADKLKQLNLYDGSFLRFNETESRNITENLFRLLPSLVSLSTLLLSYFTFTDNIITRPCDMKNLQEITFTFVTMSMATWCRFIDCLPELPQVVTVRIIGMDIRDELFGFRMCHENKVALQHVREKTKVFRVIVDNMFYICFTTKKV